MNQEISNPVSFLVKLLLLFAALPALALGQSPPELKDPTPGASLKAVLMVIGDLQRAMMYREGDVAYYRLRAKGFPKNEKLYLWVWSRGSSPNDVKAISVIASGGAEEIFQYKGSGVPFGVAIPQAIPGLRVVIMLATEDGRIRAWMTAMPRPLEARKGACQVRAEISEDYGAAYEIAAQGFPPGDDLKITLAWADQSQESSGKVKDDGTWTGQIKLNAMKQESFKARLTLAGKSCSVSLPLERKIPKRK